MRRASLAGGALVVLVLALHVHTRVWTHGATPPDQKHFWPSSYLVSLSILTGNGFAYLLPADANTGISILTLVEQLRARPDAVGPVMDFLSGDSRQQLSERELADYVASGAKAVPIDLEGGGLMGSRWETTRILDIRIAALVWRVFGVRWSALFAFYALVSAAAGLCVFLIVRQLTRSYWGGLVGCLGFLASPLERVAGAWSIRDANPLWFTVLAFYLLFRLGGGVAGSERRSWLGWFVVGAGSLLGLGWRSDAQLLPPFVLLSMLVLLAARRAGLRRLALAAALFVAGAFSMRAAIDVLGPGARGQGGSIVFEIAWYGEHIRSDILGTENAFQVKQDDYLTMYQANYFRQQRTGEELRNRALYEPRFLEAVRAMYLELARYNAHSWWRTFPAFLWRHAHVDRALIPGPSAGGLAVEDSGPGLMGRWGWSRWLYAATLKRYVSWLPGLFALGFALSLLHPESRLPVLLIGGYFVYYSAALLMVLPESKHWPPLLFPLHVVAATGLCWALRSPRWWRSGPAGGWKRAVMWCAAVFAAVAAVWACAGLVGHALSKAERRRITGSVLAAAATSREEVEIPPPGKLFTVTTAGEAADARVGYLLKVRGAQRPVDLYCVHMRDPTPAGSAPLYYYTRHRVEPNRDQLLFVNLVTGSRIADDRPYTLHVRVRGRAQLLSARRVDLSQWSLGLPLSLVFTEGDNAAGGSLMPDFDRVPVTDEFVTRQDAEAFVRVAP